MPSSATASPQDDAVAESLRNEILGFDAAKLDVLKWKLVLIAALSTAGLGLGSTSRVADTWPLLCLLPFACLYCDFLYLHLTLMIVKDNFFLRTNALLARTSWSAFEQEGFAWQFQKIPLYRLERVVALGTTVVLCSALAAAGLLLTYRVVQPPRIAQPGSPFPFLPISFTIAGCLGLASLLTLYVMYSRREQLFRASGSRLIRDE
jgi:hypothetical protein